MHRAPARCENTRISRHTYSNKRDTLKVHVKAHQAHRNVLSGTTGLNEWAYRPAAERAAGCDLIYRYPPKTQNNYHNIYKSSYIIWCLHTYRKWTYYISNCQFSSELFRYRFHDSFNFCRGFPLLLLGVLVGWSAIDLGEQELHSWTTGRN